ncbi:protein farnesyltransferase beta subunit, putative [Coccidioides posadasii C735 delta SOWgp]|uniref:Protein farnesyltransferase subunit beta n=4 Tax=Coccidioides posadasii TaxID=199306 RepID=E9DIZ6_COCPS|nr:protein farnesyltransferase beta subunit, putative [Coccidioides posadasii C735 delta SOWgp]EER24306.1 protein farnesyltransferase beta subunit, putative [Coccidioides posadasii C735 delta SOWgp]EFW13581.1 farnesyltransferase subunit beta [Coccidioides posadasii str. Silveira]KMM65980.1 farnesyltransferase subunit beta [Coccidioides posadasii RMSCC 3488]|eukprot:XP_003066451.1 protein farnesyltransferase beta subunit, putative [Coccidioides posadasii C735 delta SOWgp]
MATGEQPPRRGVPALFTQFPAIRDDLDTETSRVQEDTVKQCLPFLKGVAQSLYGPFNEHGIPSLYRDVHVAYLYDALEEYPGKFVGLDASRPWMMYWALTGLYLLGADVTRLRKRVISTAAPMQNPTGGFGGGHGQMSHCASSYAVILSLATVGGAEAFSLVDRVAFWKWLGQLKQPDGGFQVCLGGEEDVRGAYCVMVMVALLDLPTELPPDAPARQFGYDTFMSGLPEYLSRCQTFEGGISGSPGTEAHGAYAFCALACLCILGSPGEMINKHLDVPLLISWLSARQYAPEGGFAGRTNKLVDGCYSHWVGGCWPLIQAALNGTQSNADAPHPRFGSLYSREGLTRYILGCCQSPHGGLRDKPGKHADSYHTCYTLAGLSNTQNYHFETATGSIARGPFSSAFSWSHIPLTSKTDIEPDGIVFHERDRLKVIHPLFVVPHSAAEGMKSWYESNQVPELCSS